MRKRRAFTLVELLVVIAILGVLIALLLPAINSARKAARCTKCLNNLHQLGVGMRQYIDSSNGHFPWTYHEGTTQSWIDTVAPFVERVDEMRLCPEDPLGELRVQPGASGLRGTSYVINEYVAYQTSDGYSVLDINHMSSTHSTIVLFEGANTGRATTDDHVHTSTWYAPGDVARGRAWNTIIAEIDPIQHFNQCSNYLFADGHAETITQDTIQQWYQLDIQNGTNFARPLKPN